MSRIILVSPSDIMSACQPALSFLGVESAGTSSNALVKLAQVTNETPEFCWLVDSEGDQKALSNLKEVATHKDVSVIESWNRHPLQFDGQRVAKVLAVEYSIPQLHFPIIGVAASIPSTYPLMGESCMQAISESPAEGSPATIVTTIESLDDVAELLRVANSAYTEKGIHISIECLRVPKDISSLYLGMR